MFEVKKLTRRAAPSAISHYQKIYKMVLGNSYDLSLVFINLATARKLNKKFRNKNKPANVLSFPLEKNSGEIFINVETKKEAPKFNMSYKKYIDFLLIHGALHLKGLDHGKKMDKLEQKFLKKI